MSVDGVHAGESSTRVLAEKVLVCLYEPGVQ